MEIEEKYDWVRIRTNNGEWIFNFNGKIISISRTNNSSDTYIFETISLEELSRF